MGSEFSNFLSTFSDETSNISGSACATDGSYVDIPEIPPPSDNINWENIPGERKIKFYRDPSFIICAFITVGIIAYGAYENENVTYIASDNKNKENITLFIKKEEKTHPVLFNVGLGLLGIIVGVVVDRACLVIQEMNQYTERYNRNFSKLLKSCFSGILRGEFIVVTIIIAASCIFGWKTPFKIENGMLILSGIGIGQFFSYLLKLKTVSGVVLSRILEKEKMYPGYTLAWSYYFNTLKKELDYFDRILNSRRTIELSLTRMILLLIPGTDITSIKDLIARDRMIEGVNFLSADDNIEDTIIYKLKINQREYTHFVMKCVTEPLVALRKMKVTKQVTFVNDTTYEDELKRFYKTLSEILEDAPDDEYKKKGLLVPVTVNIGQYDELDNGGLVSLIMTKINSYSLLHTGSLPLLLNRPNTDTRKSLRNKKKKKKRKE